MIVDVLGDQGTNVLVLYYMAAGGVMASVILQPNKVGHGPCCARARARANPAVFLLPPIWRHRTATLASRTPRSAFKC
jgi:hypothetical protein